MYSILKIFDLFRFRDLVARVVASTRSTRHHKIKRWRVNCDVFARGDSCADVFKRRAMKALGSKIWRHELEGTEGGEGEITGRRSQFRLMLDNRRQIYNEIFRMND
jgi:hypothetical protein